MNIDSDINGDGGNLLVSDKRSEALTKFALKFGCSMIDNNHIELCNEAELIRRIYEADRAKRESRLWWFALISAIASILSAGAAWWAVINYPKVPSVKEPTTKQVRREPSVPLPSY